MHNDEYIIREVKSNDIWTEVSIWFNESLGKDVYFLYHHEDFVVCEDYIFLDKKMLAYYQENPLDVWNKIRLKKLTSNNEQEWYYNGERLALETYKLERKAFIYKNEKLYILQHNEEIDITYLLEKAEFPTKHKKNNQIKIELMRIMGYQFL